MNQLLIILAFPLMLSACGFSDNRDVRAYNTCIARHSDDAVVCEGPRQAYEVGAPVIEAASKP